MPKGRAWNIVGQSMTDDVLLIRILKSLHVSNMWSSSLLAGILELCWSWKGEACPRGMTLLQPIAAKKILF